MPDPQKRIIVDGINFKELFYFPRIIREAAAALQPPRLVIALLTVLLLIAIGRIWDGATQANVHPDGILAGHVTESAEDTKQRRLRSIYRAHMPEEDWPEGAPDEWPKMDAASVQSELRRHFRKERRELEGEERDALDEAFTASVLSIERVRPRNTFEAASGHVASGFYSIVEGTIALSPAIIIASFGDVFVRLPIVLWDNHKAFTVIYGLISLILLAIGGGAIARMAACEIAAQERLRVTDAFQFSMTNWPRLVLAPLLPLLIIAGLALLVAAIGLVMYIPVIDIIAAALYILVLMLGFAIAFLLIGYAVAFPLFIPAVACENCDAPDAQQRAYAYVFSRPLHWLGYIIIGLIGLVLGFLVVSIFAVVILNGTAALFGAFHGHSALNAAGGFNIFDFSHRMDEVLHPRWYHGTSAWFIGLWQTLVIGLVPAYVFSYVLSASTAAYLLLRRAADGQDIEEIWRPGMIPGTLAPMPHAREEQDETSPEEQPDGDAKSQDTAGERDELESDKEPSANDGDGRSQQD